MPDEATVREAVEAYCARYHIAPAFEISELYDLHTEWTVKNYPFEHDRGCYVFYTDSHALLYIGKASRNDLGSRLYTHLGGNPNHAMTRHLSERWGSTPRFSRRFASMNRMKRYRWRDISFGVFSHAVTKAAKAA
jgi:hypothetical protein